MNLFKQACIDVLDSDNDAQAFMMIGANVQADIDDGYMFHRQLMKHTDKEEELKICAMRAIRNTEKAMTIFRERLTHAGKRENLKWILSDRRHARSLLQPLQSAKSNLSRRIDWMRSALDRLADSPGEEEWDLPSSMPPKTSTMARQ
ncbi:hypothetical protein CEP53_002448 [Fusarium sp. AF-6]|nr:hypothetical protein CEP53_002448 [Fusarium sp. AF-6]